MKKIRKSDERSALRHNYEFNRRTYPDQKFETPKPIREKIFRPYKAGEFFYLKAVPRRYYIDNVPETATTRARLKLNAKLQYRYTGPHCVLRVISPVTYEAIVNGKIRRVHAIQMKRDPSTSKKYVYLDTMLHDPNDTETDNEDDEMVFNDDHTITEEDSLSHGLAPVNEEVSVVHSLEDSPQALEDVELSDIATSI